MGHLANHRRYIMWANRSFPFIKSGQNHLARHREKKYKTSWTKEEVGKQHHGTDTHGVQQTPEGRGDRLKARETLLESHLWCPSELHG